MTLEAVRHVALVKIWYLFSNSHIPCNFLCEINNRTLDMVTQWTVLSTHTTIDIIFYTDQKGGLGVANFEWS